MYQRILVPLDGSKLAESVLPHVEAVAKAFKASSVTFLRVVEPVQPHTEADAVISDEESKKLASAHYLEAKEYLKNLTAQLKWNSIHIRAEVLPTGHPADMIVRFANKNDMNLIVIATHGRSGVLRWFMGSVAEKILRSSSTPILMIRVAHQQ